MKKRTVWVILIPALIVLLNFIIKGLFLAHNSVADDEPFSIYHAQMDIISIIKQLSTGNNPPLFEIILHFWISIFGILPFSVRFPSLVFSCITALFIYKIGRNHFNDRIAIYSSLLFIFSNYQILFAHEARAYALMGMLTSISMFYFLELIGTAKNNKWKYIVFLGANILLIYTHYFGVFVLIIQFLHIAINRKLLATHWKNVLLSFLIITIFYSPNIYVFFNRFVDSSTHGTWIQPPSGIDSLYNMLRYFTNAPLVTLVVLVTLVTSGIAYFTIYKADKINQARKLILLWFLFPFFFMFFISYKIPMFFDRYLMFVSISFYLLIAMAADSLFKQNKIKCIVPIIICILFMATTQPNITNKRNVKEAVFKVIELKTDNTIVYLSPSWYEMNFIYYYNIDCFKNYDTNNIKCNIYKYLHSKNIFPIDNNSQIDTSLIKKADKIIFLDAGADFSFSNNNILNVLNKNGTLINNYKFYEIFNVYEFRVK